MIQIDEETLYKIVKKAVKEALEEEKNKKKNLKKKPKDINDIFPIVSSEIFTPLKREEIYER
ncbi:MAG: hypothetical protein N2Z81_02585 [Hydrogenothermaceae bacterium]|nr:hypothetical protein [Hydrogenothermaceae bacterium]